MPAEVFAANSDGTNARQLTHHNESILANLEMNAPETFWFVSGDGVKVQAMVIKPPKFEAGKKYPLLVLLHGGPQTMWSNAWGYRWNAQVFSSCRICVADDQPPRLDRIRAEIHRRNHE